MTLQFIMNSLLALSPLFILLTFIVIEGYGTPTNVGLITTSMETDRTTSTDNENCARWSKYNGCQFVFVKDACPIACGNVCEDLLTNCNEMVTNGACDFLKMDMTKWCAKSCHFCDTDQKPLI
ncbi:uncharacterized protein LOC131887078 isoform X1 [Tigriopus californicus]|uniref:uncharacterized protein LOC131887078 isoform X1 n=1 Tax=Tigriopus californicus TaxID=6832 RepID=UPI0027DA86FC|nr:uncharacterized protein LOC131887078 isoform X1 [Tigriopus californicus]